MIPLITNISYKLTSVRMKDSGFKVQKIFALFVFVLMVVPIVSVPLGNGHDSYGSPASKSMEGYDEMELVELEDGRYTLVSDYIKEMFQVTDSISDVTDPIGSGMIGVVPMEILAQTAEGEFKAYEYNGSSTSTIATGFDQGQLSVSFAARLVKGEPDYICQLSCVKVDGGYVIQLDAHDGKDKGYSMRADAEDIGFLNSELVEGIPVYQSINVLQYEVADFDGDSSEEIAILEGDFILFVEFDEETSQLEIFRKVGAKYSSVWLDAPTDLVAADIDSDGIEELVMLRSDYTLEPGNNESTWIAVYDIMELKLIWKKLKIDDPSTGNAMDMVMVSGTTADIDGDMTPELVIGGYLWDNSNTDPDYLSSSSNNAGELFLSYMEFDELNDSVINFKGTTVLKDDNGTATTRYNGDADDNFKKHYDFNDHDSKDTSIYVTDESRYGEFTRSMNWSNWTIPLASGSFKGIVNERLMDQVFFDVGMYEFDGTGFKLMGLAPKFTHLMDENNVICNYIESGMIKSQDASDFSSVESVFVSYQVDLNEHTHYGEGELEVAFVIYDYDGTSVTAKYGNDNCYPYKFRIEKDWDGTYNPMPIIADIDDDSYYAEVAGHLFTYTDPTVIAVLSAVPYQQDLADVLLMGSDQVGVTSYSSIDGTVTGSSWNNSFQVGVGGSFGNMFTLVQADMELGYNRDDSWFEETTTTFTTEFQSSHNSIAMYVTPVDVYFYNVTGKDETGTIVTATIPVPFFGKPYCSIFDERDYSAFVDNYNSIMEGYLGDEFVKMEKVPLSGNVEGDITSYDYIPTDPIVEPKSIGYDQSGEYSTVSTSVEVVTEEGKSQSNGGHFNFNASIGSMFATADFAVSDTVTYTTSTSDLSGTGFSVTLAQGNENNYIGYKPDAEGVLSQYTMGGTMWAEKRAITYGDEETEYVYVGFTVDRYTVAPKMGSIVPDIYVPDGSDENDIFNPTADSVCLQLTIPGKDVNYKVGDSYTVQMEYQGQWYDVSGIFDFTVDQYDGKAWVPSEGSFVPAAEDTSVWVRVSGLSELSDTYFNFRLNTKDMNGSNPTLSVKAYKDTRVTSEQFVLCDKRITTTLPFVSNEAVIVDESHLRDHKYHRYILSNIGAEPGEYVDLFVKDRYGNLELISTNNLVYRGGYVLFEQQVPDESYYESIFLVALTVVTLLALAILITGRR